MAVKLTKYTKLVLNLAIKFGGSTIKDFKNIKGKSGLFQKEFKFKQFLVTIRTINNTKFADRSFKIFIKVFKN